MRLEIEDLEIKFGRRMPVSIIKGFNLQVPAGQFVAIVGPSGCGKSTLLGAICGLLRPADGAIRFLVGDSPVRPRCHMSFQDHRLFPWLNALENATLGLEALGVAKEIRNDRALKLMHRFGLEGAAHLYPDQLSGGMKQRIALIRMLVSDGDVLLFDEPLSALDAQNRVYLQQELRDICQEEHRTAIYVTHDIEEALFLSQRVIVLGYGAKILDDIVVSESVRSGIVGSVNHEREALRWAIWQLMPRPLSETALLTTGGSA